MVFNCGSIMFMHAITSIHAGSGSDLGLVDLPVQREKHTGYPKIESSSLKGALRAAVCQDNGWVEVIFGKELEKGNNDAAAGAAAFSDARILFFPVRSLKGVFAWVTCPFVLNRLKDELIALGYYDSFVSKHFDGREMVIPLEYTVASNHLMVSGTNAGRICLAEYAYEVRIDGEAAVLAQQFDRLLFKERKTTLAQRLVILPDDDFLDFVTLHTEVNARIRINGDTGTVDAKDGALWYEENVPPETVFYSLCFFGQSRLKGKDWNAQEIRARFGAKDFIPECFQLGGDSTLGRGILRRIVYEL